MIDTDVHGPLESTRQPLRPLNRGHTTVQGQLVEPQIIDFNRLQTIKVHVMQRQASAALFLNQRKCRTGDGFGIDPEPFGQSADEGRFSGAQIAGEQHH